MSGLSGLDAYVLSKGYTDETVIGGGALKGKNCAIKSTEAIEGGTKVTFAWYLDDGTEKNTSINVMNGASGEQGEDGVGIASFKVEEIDSEVYLICVMTDGTESNPIPIPTVAGKDGKDGKDGQDGKDGVGVPTGGLAGQVLVKNSDADDDTKWATPSSGISFVDNGDNSVTISYSV